MYSELYLKSVMLVFKKQQSVSCFESVVKRINDKKIEVKGMTTGNMEMDEAYEKETLYITDCNRAAAELRKRDLPVLGWRHEEGDSLPDLEYVIEGPPEVEIDYLDRVYRRYHDIPWNILETERCVIRETAVEDAERFFAIYESPGICRYMEGLHADVQQEKAYIRDYIEKMYRYYEFGIWTVIWKATGEIIGRAGLAVREGYELPDLGYVIDVPWQGRGVAYEICDAILQYAREEFEFERVQALVMRENEASLALCRKLGFEERETIQEGGKEYFLLVKDL